MKRLTPPIALLVAVLLGLVPGATAIVSASDPEALALLRRSESLLRADTSVARYRMDLIRPDWRRTLRFRAHDDRDRDRFRIELLEPRKVAGTVFLKVGPRLWMDLTRLGRRVAISPAMMQDAWMGSDFSHQDLLEASALIEGYEHAVLRRDQTPQGEVVTIRSVPLADGSALWGSLVQRIRADGIPLVVDYQDVEGNAWRRLSFYDVRDVGGRTLPTRWVMESLNPAGWRTELILESAELDTVLQDSLFEAAGPGARPE